MVQKRISVLAICPANWTGVRKSISQGADAYADIRTAKAAIREHNPSLVRFGGYRPEWRRLLKFARSRGCRIVVTIHHTPAFHEFAASSRTAIVEAIRAFRDGLVDALESPHEGVAETLTGLGVPCAPRKNTTAAPPYPHHLPPRPGLHIGIFGTGLPWKNMDTQVLAAALTLKDQPDGVIHIQRLGDPSLMKTLGVPYEVHPRLDEVTFSHLVASMTLNMAVNFTETFGYFPVESFLLGVPCMFSPMTPAFHDLGEESPLWSCRVDRVDDPAYTSRKIKEVLDNRGAIAEAGRAFCQRHLTNWT